MSRIATSGQARINAKRTARTAYWVEERRTVHIHVSKQIEPYFRQHMGALGAGTRIDGSWMVDHGFAVDLDVHIPGAPARAVRAVPIFRSEWHGDHYEPVLDHVEWTDADGNRIHPEAEAILAEAREALVSPDMHRAQLGLVPLLSTT